jgi:signal transduction histidine kinase/ActR/RegA family two-component response regulator
MSTVAESTDPGAGLRRSSRRRLTPELGVLVGGVLVAAISFFLIFNHDREHDWQNLSGVNAERGLLVRQTLERYSEVLRSIARMQAFDETNVLASLQVLGTEELKRNPAFHAIEWVTQEAADGREVSVIQARQQEVADSDRVAESAADKTSATVQRHPSDLTYKAERLKRGASELQRFDVRSDETRPDALRRAVDGGQPIVTGRIALGNAGDDSFGVIIAMPVYRAGANPTTIEARRATAKGALFGVLRVDRLIDEALNDSKGLSAAQMYLFDSSAQPGERLLYHRASSAQRGEPRASAKSVPRRPRHVAASFDVAGRTWSLIIKPSQGFEFRLALASPAIIAVFVLLVATVLALLLYRSNDRAREIEQLVAERTKQFFDANVSLRSEIEERKKVQEQLNQSQKMDAIGQLTGGVAHDFNNLLMVIDGYARRAERALDQGKSVDIVREALSAVVKAGEKATALTRQLLVFSRRQIMEKTVFEPASVVRDMEELLCRSVGEQFELNIAVDDDIAYVETDSGELSQVVMNLVINARDAMPDGGVIIVGVQVADLDEETVAQHPGLAPGRYVEIFVKDEGTGIDDDTLCHIFEPFFTTKEQGKGTGLGLAMVYGFVKQSEGMIDVASIVGRGSTFRIYLPVVDRAPESRIAEEEDLPLGHGETILLVEDDTALLALTHGLLDDLGYNVLTAHDGLEALVIEDEHDGDIDLLLTDVVMPTFGGFELALAITETRPDTSIIFISGYAKNKFGLPVELTENAQFLQKPVQPGRLAQVVRNELDQKGSRLTRTPILGG